MIGYQPISNHFYTFYIVDVYIIWVVGLCKSLYDCLVCIFAIIYGNLAF